ncbi:MAG: HAD family hydrolase [Candidatus Pacebacteria bacterium]|nr:HAD family hydrolase [Candidatus Paceibacterota bacterium]
MKNIIFDWSGVIKDAVKAQLWATNKVFQKHGVEPLSLEQFREDWEQPYQLFYNKYIPDISLEEEGRDYREAMTSTDCPKSGVFPQIAELIIDLKRMNNLLVVVSSDHKETLLKEIELFGLKDIFDKVISEVHDKSDSVEGIIKEYQLEPEETYFIGDSNHEVEVAKKFGIHSVAVTWGFCNEKRLSSVEPDFLVHNPQALQEILLNS